VGRCFDDERDSRESSSRTTGCQCSGRSPHEGRILRLLRDSGPASRTKLSDVSGLSPTTLTKIVAPLIDRGVLRENVDDSRTRIGRPALTLTPIPEAVTVCGVQISIGEARIGLADATCRVRRTSTLHFDPKDDPEDVLGMIADAIESLLAEEPDVVCTGIGIGVPGTVDEAHRRIRLLINLGWRDIGVSDLLEGRLGIPVVVDHNVRSMALAEARYDGHQTEALAYLYIKRGVDLGVVIKGHSFSGGSGGESYLGHTRVVADGLPCSCGSRGCLDTIASEPHIREPLASITGEDPASFPADMNVLQRLQEETMNGNPLAVALQEDILSHLANALSTVVNLFTPELLLVGGILSRAPEAVVMSLRERVRDRIFPLLRGDFRLEKANSGDDAMVRGAAAIALELLHYA